MKNLTLIALGLSAGFTALAQSPVSLNIADVATAKVGVLGQLQFQSNTDPILQGTSDNFVVRRIRLFVGGTVGDHIDYLVDTDQPKTGLVTSNLSGVKQNQGSNTSIYVQDAVLTYRFDKAFVLDGGLLTIDPNHNGLTSSARYYGNDASAYASLQNTPLNDTTNREVGLSSRGLLGDHFEYHFALTNGLRVNANDQLPTQTTPTNPPAAPASNAAAANTTVSSNNALRVTVRGQYDLFDNEGAGYTAAGNYFGHKKIVAFGLGYDRQDAYRQTTGDVFVDLPVNNGDVFTAEADYWIYDGGTFLPTLLKQKDWSLQAGYTFGPASLSPIIRIEQKRYDKPGTINNVNTNVSTPSPNSNLDEDRESVGVAYWIKEQRANLKVFYNYIKPTNVAGTVPTQNAYHQITAQFQISAW